MDYAYTINGWLKGMNGSALNPGLDMGKDGTTGYLTGNSNVHLDVAADMLGYTLGYFNNDYSPIGGIPFEAASNNTSFGNAAPELFNGNIRHSVMSVHGLDVMGSAYTYDQLNRLTSMTAFYNPTIGTSLNWSTGSATQDYYSQYSYDRNGNLTFLKRRGHGLELNMDDFVYHPIPGTNKLDYVQDNGVNFMTGSDPTYADIKNGAQGTGNYQYDALGQLVTDYSEDNQYLEWRRGDKKLKKTVQVQRQVEFVYNPMGQRVLKIVKPRDPSSGDILGQSLWEYTYYAYDANGQLMAVYDIDYSLTNAVYLQERHIYGASRLGMIQEHKLIRDGNTVPEPPALPLNTLGLKRYELTNWLGNVNVLINDRTLVSTNSQSKYVAVSLMESDYYPFGMTMPGRNNSYTSEGYRYAYNGMEQDPEAKGTGNSYTTEFRQYDPRLGRWMSLDPMMGKYPNMSPYVAFNNNPVYFVDPLGLEGEGNGEPEVGYTCYDENGNHLQYDGNGEWSDYVQQLDEVTITATGDFTQGHWKPIIEHDHGHRQDYPKIGYVYSGPREPTPAEKRSERWWNFKAFGATLIRWDLGNALPAYKHFQDATGYDYYVDFEDYFDDDNSATVLLENATEMAKSSAERLLTTSGNIEMTSQVFTVSETDPRFPYPETEDWQKATGGFPFYMTAKVTAEEIGGKINYTMELTINMEDRYNFNPGQKDIATGTPDGANGIFEITGLGREFMQYGFYTVTVSWTK